MTARTRPRLIPVPPDISWLPRARLNSRRERIDYLACKTPGWFSASVSR
jgi:hypothetical protein